MNDPKRVRINLRKILEWDKYLYTRVMMCRGEDGVYDLPEQYYGLLQSGGCIVDDSQDDPS